MLLLISLASTGKVFRPLVETLDTVSGSHVPNRTQGSWIRTTTAVEEHIHIPSRDKDLSVCSDTAVPYISERLKTLDSEDRELTQLQKYRKLVQEHPDLKPSWAFINSTGTHCSWSVLAFATPIYVLGLLDSTGAQIMFSVQDYSDHIRAQYPRRFWLYRFPVLQDKALFFPTQAMCSRWWKWSKSLGDPLRCFNALESSLFSSDIRMIANG